MSPLSQHYGVVLADPPWTFATYLRIPAMSLGHSEIMSLAVPT